MLFYCRYSNLLMLSLIISNIKWTLFIWIVFGIIAGCLKKDTCNFFLDIQYKILYECFSLCQIFFMHNYHTTLLSNQLDYFSQEGGSIQKHVLKQIQQQHKNHSHRMKQIQLKRVYTSNKIVRKIKVITDKQLGTLVRNSNSFHIKITSKSFPNGRLVSENQTKNTAQSESINC